MVCVEIFLGSSHNLLLGQGLNLLVLLEGIQQRGVVGEAVHQDIHLDSAALEGQFELLVEHSLDRRDTPVFYLSGLELVNLLHDDLLGCLVVLEHTLVDVVVRHSLDKDASHVSAAIQTAAGHLNVTVDSQFVQQTCTHSVGQQRSNKRQRHLVLMSLWNTFVCPDNHGVVAQFVAVFGIAFEANHFVLTALGQLFRLQTRERLLNHRLGGLCVEVAHENQCHVVGHIPCVVELNQFGETRVLQVLGFADDVTLVGVTFVNHLHGLLLPLRRGLVGVHVILFEHILQLSLERTEYGVNQSVRENGQPAIHLSRREGVMISRQVVAGEGVDALGTNTVQQVEEILRSRNLGLAHGALVDLRSKLLAYLRICSVGKLVIKRYDRIIDRFFCLPVHSANTLRAFEEHVLQIMCQTRVFCRLVDSACTNHYVTGYIRLVVVFPQHNSQTVIQFVLLQFLRQLRCKSTDAQQRNHQSNNLFHLSLCYN